MSDKKSFLRVIFSQRMAICICIGFTSGMPLYVLIQLIPAWLRDQGVGLKSISLFALIMIPYNWKFIWSPLMDRFVPPFLGRRRGWALGTQLGLFALLVAFALWNPAGPQGNTDITEIAVTAFLVALFSASQDIVLDAYRRELLPDAELGLGNAFFVNAYRLSGLIPGSLALILADHIAWEWVHVIVGLFMLIGLITTLLMPEPDVVATPRTFREAVVDPFKDFFGRRGVRSATSIIAFMLLYKLGDSMATALSTPFYLDLGFSKTEIGSVAKIAGLWSSIFGGFVGGIIMLRTGINRALWLFGVVQVISILGFAILADAGAHSVVLWDLDLLLFGVVSFEYLGVGLGTAAIVAFMARSTNRKYTATQFALLSSLTALPRTFANAATGFLVEGAGPDSWIANMFGPDNPLAKGLGWTNFFLFCTVLALPGMALLYWVAPWNGDPETALLHKPCSN